MSWITRTLSATLWSLWRCFPPSMRLAVYHWLRRRYGETGSSVRVHMLPFGLVIKEGLVQAYYEAANIRFVANNTSIPVPRILDAIEYTPSGRSRPTRLLLMTRLEGQPLSKWLSNHAIRAPGEMELFERMDHCMATDDIAGLSAVIEQLKALPPPVLDLNDAGPLIQDLRNAFRELRALPPPASPAVSGLSGKPLSCNRAGESNFIGPFEDQQDFKDYLFAQVHPVVFARFMPTIRRLAEPVNARRHRICFTHADLAARNILVKDGRLSGIVDWEFAGWYPEYWELATMEMQMIRQALANQFWDAVQLFGPERYEDELALEWALQCCMQMSPELIESGDDVYISCPRVKKPATQAPTADGVVDTA